MLISLCAIALAAGPLYVAWKHYTDPIFPLRRGPYVGSPSSPSDGWEVFSDEESGKSIAVLVALSISGIPRRALTETAFAPDRGERAQWTLRDLFLKKIMSQLYPRLLRELRQVDCVAHESLVCQVLEQEWVTDLISHHGQTLFKPVWKIEAKVRCLTLAEFEQKFGASLKLAQTPYRT